MGKRVFEKADFGLVQFGWQPQRSPLTLTLSPTKPEERGQEKTTATRSHRDLNHALISIFAAVIESGLEGSCANIDICLIRRTPCSFIAPFGNTAECCPGSWPKVFIRTAK